MQSAVNTTIGEAVFAMWFVYIHCGVTDVFSMDPTRDYVSNPVVNQNSAVERERAWSESSAVEEERSG
jgi:hypothetical protein